MYSYHHTILVIPLLHQTEAGDLSPPSHNEWTHLSLLLQQMCWPPSSRCWQAPSPSPCPRCCLTCPPRLSLLLLLFFGGLVFLRLHCRGRCLVQGVQPVEDHYIPLVPATAKNIMSWSLNIMRNNTWREVCRGHVRFPSERRGSRCWEDLGWSPARRSGDSFFEKTEKKTKKWHGRAQLANSLTQGSLQTDFFLEKLGVLSQPRGGGGLPIPSY